MDTDTDARVLIPWLVYMLLGCPAARHVQPFGLSLMKLIPTLPFLYACISASGPQKSFLPNLFTTSFDSIQQAPAQKKREQHEK